MANNRMWLVNERLGVKVVLAKFYPSTGWSSPEGCSERLDAAFDGDDAPTGQSGLEDWKLVYEDENYTAEYGASLRTITSAEN